MPLNVIAYRAGVGYWGQGGAADEALPSPDCSMQNGRPPAVEANWTVFLAYAEMCLEAS